MEILAAIYLIICIIVYYLIQNRYERIVWNHQDDINESSSIFHQDIYINATDSSLIHGWFYPRKGVLSLKTEDSIILMCHGLGSQKDMGLERYASRFLKSGYSVISIDYRSFGRSENIFGSSVRHWIQPWYQIDDIISTLQAIKSDKVLGLSTRNVKSIFLWGTSFGGGHVLEAANKIQSQDIPIPIKGIISQIPHLDGNTAAKNSMKARPLVETIRIVILCIFDTILSQYLHSKPFLVKIASLKNETSFMPYEPTELKKYFEKHPKQYIGNWHNLATARSFAYMKFYNPIQIVHNIKFPVLYIGASDDNICPLDSVIQAVNATKNSDLYVVKGTHHDVYSDKVVSDVTKQMITFMNKYNK